MIGSVYYSQKELMGAIKKLYSIDRFCLDATYNTGSIHYGQDPLIKSDINPLSEDVISADCTNLDFISSGSINYIVFDPPFLAGGGATGKISNKYSSFKNVEEMLCMYEKSLHESLRILDTRGILVFKCQDLMNGRVQTFSHCEIYNMATKLGFYARDLFVLVNHNRMKPHNMKNQLHSRKCHSYFWVFEKCRKKNKKLKKDK